MRAAGMMLFIKSHEPDMLRLVCFVYTFCVALTTSDITWLSFFALTSVVAITHPGLVNPFHRSVDMSFTWFWQDHLGIHARVFLSLVYIASLEAARYWHCNLLNMGQPAMYDGPRPVVEFCFLVRLAVAAKGGFLVALCYSTLPPIILPNAPAQDLELVAQDPELVAQDPELVAQDPELWRQQNPAPTPPALAPIPPTPRGRPRAARPAHALAAWARAAVAVAAGAAHRRVAARRALRERRRRHGLEMPSGYICPITYDVMQDPVMAVDGHTYERSAVSLWFSTNRTSPLTGAWLWSTELLPNITLRKLIQDHQQE
jgi:hypothetical protein